MDEEVTGNLHGVPADGRKATNGKRLMTDAVGPTWSGGCRHGHAIA